MKCNYLTMDINIAYSMINMKLRDFYSSIDEMCEDEEINKEDIILRFKENGFVYDKSVNQFLRK